MRNPSSQKQPTQFPNMFALVHFCEGVLNCALKPICQTMKRITLVANCTRDCIHVVIQLNLREKKTSRKVKIPSPKIAHDESPNSASAMTLNFIGRHQGPVVSPHWQLGWTGWSNFSILSRTAGDRRRISQTDGDLPFTRTSWR